MNEKELKSLGEFIESPFHNKHKEVQALCHYLLKSMKLKQKKHLEAEVIFKAIYPNKKFALKDLHHLFSYLYKLVEEFIALREWQANPLPSQLALLKFYNRKKAEKNFKRLEQQSRNALDRLAYRDLNYHKMLFEINFQSYLFSESQGRKEDINLHAVSGSLDNSYCIERLKIACYQLSHKAVFKTEYEEGMLQKVIDFVEDKIEENPPVLNLYFFAYKVLYDSSDEISFRKMRTSMISEGAKIRAKDLKEVYLFAINFCIRRINSNEPEYINEVFSLYKSGLENRVFLENGLLSKWTYNNIVIAGLKLKSFEWVEGFIHDYKSYLDPMHRESSFAFNLAKFYFEKQDFKSAMPLLLQMEYDDIFHNLAAKTLLAKMYFELSEFDALDNLLNSFKVYILRNKVIGYHKENYKNFIRLSTKLMNLNMDDADKREKLLSDIQTVKILTERKWFLEKLEI